MLESGPGPVPPAAGGEFRGTLVVWRHCEAPRSPGGFTGQAVQKPMITPICITNQ